MIAFLRGVLNRLSASKSDDGKVAGILSKLKDHEALPLARHKLLTGFRLMPGESSENGDTPPVLSDKAVSCREFRWASFADEDCQWHSIRWRFYSTGLISFHAEMTNSSHGFDRGDIQGHRIELRDRTGFLIGIWAAGFYVKRDGAGTFQADIVDEHPPLKLHFDQLADIQRGQWIRT